MICPSDPTLPIFKLFSPKLTIIRLKMWPLERTQGVSDVLPSDLVFHPKLPIFRLMGDFIKTNMLIKFHDYPTENVASKAYMRLF